MRLLNRTDFLKLPAGVWYAKGKQWYFQSLQVKYETTSSGNDWWSLDPCWIDTDTGGLGETVDCLEAMLEQGCTQPMQTAISRDGLAEPDALFLVFEGDDLKRLHKLLHKAMDVTDDALEALK
jgi:hypothetical protein